jgi:murein DD-endopeptidase MepM/ murein hydrolase activator NlpD
VPANGGAHYGETPKVHGLASLPRLRAFRLSSRTLTSTATFTIAAPRTVRDVRLQLLAVTGTRVVKTLKLGDRRPGRVQKVLVSKTGLAAGKYRLRISARGLRTAGVAAVTTVSVPSPPRPKPKPPARVPGADGHIFPVRGPYTFGGADARFGTGRTGHTHQGQDIPAAEGTPVVSPHAGTVTAVRYQADGAGHYVVIDSAGEDRDYVFMHLRTGSTLVTTGQIVSAGQAIAQVGNTGASFGAHLHFEIWVNGGWYTGGHPVDPLPFLQAWAG